MLRAFVVDDEPLTADLIGRFLEDTGMVTVERTFYNPLEVIKEVGQTRPDIIFLDIEMPEISGIDLARSIGKVDDEVYIVFITAYEQYALEAFKVNAIDYILKPIMPEDLRIVINKVVKRRNRRNQIETSVPETNIILLGEFSVINKKNASPIVWITAKAEELFAYLLLHENKWISKWTIIELLWPDSDPKKSEQNLYTTIWRLKKTLLDSEVSIQLKSKKGYSLLELTNCDIDFKKFEEFLGRKWSITEETFDEFERAILLYNGDLFGDKAYDWCIIKRESLHISYCETVKQLALFSIEKMNYKKASYLLKLLLREVPYDNEITELLAKVEAEVEHIFEIEHK